MTREVEPKKTGTDRVNQLLSPDPDFSRQGFLVSSMRIDIDSASPGKVCTYGKPFWGTAIHNINEYSLGNLFSKLLVFPVGDQVFQQTLVANAIPIVLDQDARTVRLAR